MLRFSLLVCCVAYAAAEADPYYGYGYSGYAGYAGYGGYVGPHAAPATSAAIVIRGYGQPATIGQTLPYGYAASGHYVADSVGAVHIAKRSAEADPYYGYGYAGYAGHGGYTGYAGHSGYAGYAGYGGYVGPHAAPATSAAIAIRGYGQPATIGQTLPYGYAASGHYVADSVGAVHIAKRSAEADPYYGYGGYGYYGPVASGISSVSYAGFPLQGYSHGYGFGW